MKTTLWGGIVVGAPRWALCVPGGNGNLVPSGNVSGGKFSVMKLFSQDRSELLRVEALERRDNDLVIRGRVFGSMPISARLGPEEARKGLKLLNFRLVLFLLTLPFRRSRRPTRAP